MSPKVPDPGTLDAAVTKAADRVVKAAVADFFAPSASRGAVIVTAPAGAGKSGLVCTAVAEARRRKLRVAVATPTNEQAFGLVRRLAEQDAGMTVSFVPARTKALPDSTAALPNVEQIEAKEANSRRVLVGTLNKLGDAYARHTLGPVDVLVIDEGYQADSSRYFGVGHLAPHHLLVGDGGQLSPFAAIEDADRWRGLPEDPLQTAVGVLMRNHPLTSVHKLPITRRLDGRAVPVARAFYPDLPFEAAVRSGVREMRLGRGRATVVDRVLDQAAESGWAHVELPRAAVLTADPETIGLLVSLVTRLFERKPRVRCEWRPAWADLKAPRVAVGVSHNDQKDLLRSALDQAGLEHVVVDTANRLQGLEFDVVVAWHPLAGLPEPDGFHLEPGRLCVLLTRHRHACILVGRAGDRELLDAIPPRTPAFLGWDPDPVLDGWEVHQSVFSALQPFRIGV